MNSSRRKLPWLLLAMVGATRILVAILIGWHNGKAGFLENDSGGYIRLSESLLHGSFSISGPEIYRTPGYPLLLSPATALGHVLFFGIIENVLLAVASALMVWRITKELTGSIRAATWAVLIFCFEPVGLLYSVQILSDTLFTFCMLLAVWFLLCYFKSMRPASLTGSGVALAVATYVRPISLYLPLALAAILLFFPGRLPRTRRVFMAASFLAVFAIGLAPWVVRNERQAGYRNFSSSGDYNLYFYAAAAVQAKIEHKGFSQTQLELGHQHYFDVHPEQRMWSPGEIARFWRSQSMRIIGSHIFTYSGMHAKGCLVVLFDTTGTELARLIGLYPKNGGKLLARMLDIGLLRGTWWFLRSYPWAAGLYIILTCALVASYCLAFQGIRTLPREHSILLIAIIAYLVLVSGMPGAVGRYRAPWMPLLCVAAAKGLAASLEKRYGAQAGMTTDHLALSRTTI